MTFLDGVWMRRVEARHCAAVGEALAKLHLAGADFNGRRANALSVDEAAAAIQFLRRPHRHHPARHEGGDRRRTRLPRTCLAARICPKA